MGLAKPRFRQTSLEKAASDFFNRLLAVTSQLPCREEWETTLKNFEVRMAVSLLPLAKAVAVLLWADEKITVEEWHHAESLFCKHDIDWQQARAALESNLEVLLSYGDLDDGQKAQDEPFHLGVLDFGETDFFEVLCDLARIAAHDGVVTFKELELLHAFGKACNENEVLVTAAILLAAHEQGARLEFNNLEG